MAQYLFRFLVGGAIVSVFACLGDVLKPKSFAGLFGAAPSVALATLGLPAPRWSQSTKQIRRKTRESPPVREAVKPQLWMRPARRWEAWDWRVSR